MGKKAFSFSEESYDEKQILPLIFAPNVYKRLHRLLRRKGIIFLLHSSLSLSRKIDGNSNNVALDGGRST
jgi:hypothetical protein